MKVPPLPNNLKSTLQILTLSENKIQDIPPNYFQSTIIRTLKLDRNLLGKIPDVSFLRNTLKRLDLRKNNISSLGILTHIKLPHLKELILSFNRIHQVDFHTFDNFADVVDISLNSNRLTRLDIKILNATVFVDFSENLWFCDPKKPWQPPCKLVDEGDFMGVYDCGKLVITSIDRLSCKAPPDMVGVTMLGAALPGTVWWTSWPLSFVIFLQSIWYKWIYT